MSYYKKPRTPWEFRNAREWDPDRKGDPLSSDDEDEHERKTHSVAPTAALDHDDNDGFKPVVKRFTKIQEAKKIHQKPVHARREPATNKGNSAASENTQSFYPLKKLQSRHDHQTMASSQGSKSSNVERRVPYRIRPQDASRSQQPTTKDRVVKDSVPVGNQSSDQPPPLFRFQGDNSARASFRRREPSSGLFQFHKNIIEIEPDPSHLECLLIEIGIRIGSFVRPPQSAQDRELLIWGSQKQVLQTQEELRTWIRQIEGAIKRKPTGKVNFSREKSTIGTLYRIAQREMLKKAEIARFQQVPDSNQIFEFQGAYLWPIEDVVPQDIFGPSLEAFDPIRFALKSHIVFSDILQSFRIYTNEDRSIAKAFKLIEGTLREFHARNACSGWPSSLLIVDLPKDQGRFVRIQTWSSQGQTTEHRLPRLTGDKLDCSKGNSESESDLQSANLRISNDLKIQQALRLTLPSIRFHRGQINMRILFGTFALTRFKWPKENPPSVPFDDFFRNVTGAGTKGQMLRDLRITRPATEVLSEIYSLTTILQPLDSMSDSLEEAVQTYSARFEFNRFEKIPVQLEVEMHTSTEQSGLFQKTNAAWTRLDRRDHIAPVDITTIRLEGGVSWKFQISTEHPLEKWRIDQQMIDFADSVRIRVSQTGAGAGTELNGRKVFSWGGADTASIRFLKPTVFEQKTALRYRLADDQAFVFELARYDSYDLSTDAQCPCTTHWGASMWNSDWEVILSANAGLGLGEYADWDARLPAFFPKPYPSTKNGKEKEKEKEKISDIEPGLDAFLDHIRVVTECLDRIRNVPV